ncbi:MULTISPECIES: ABC transporter substrate-binding protein [unclassified Curtobacterium]|uniref:ABC transporter substrate-binding protein n=1 Tax=unclassified Curtobacterium TaxID=257496 RepID=UPI003A8032A9
MQKLVDEWNAKNPNIQVKYSAQSGGDDATFSKITTAAQAGDAPDLVQSDVKWVTSLVQYAKDVTKDASTYEKNYTKGAWSNVTLDGVTYGIPQDSGPVIYYYNKAKFAEYGLTVPKTWDEFATEAKKVATEHPGTYLAGFSSDDTENLQSYIQQAGGKWWSIDGKSWKVDIDGATSEKVASTFQDLIDSNALSPTKRWDPTFYNDLTNNKILSVVGAGWQAPLIADSAKAGSGDWAVAPAPQWTAGKNVSANNGGSELLVMNDKHTAAALKFANWLNTNTTGLMDLGLFPATANAKITTPENIKTYFSGDDVYGLLSDAANNVDTQWLFAPGYATFSKSLSDGIADVRNGKTTLPKLLQSLQSQSLSDLKSAGISASAGS